MQFIYLANLANIFQYLLLTVKITNKRKCSKLLHQQTFDKFFDGVIDTIRVYNHVLVVTFILSPNSLHF